MPTTIAVEEVALEAVGEQLAELGDADQRRDADQADVADRGHPQPGGDDRDGQRQLDREEAAPARL